MDFETFQQSISANTMPSGSSVYLQSLWHDAREDWNQAHELIQDLNDQPAAWTHAYLHRKEGDVWNANYWYNKAGKRMPGYSLQQEWEELVKAML